MAGIEFLKAAPSRRNCSSARRKAFLSLLAATGLTVPVPGHAQSMWTGAVDGDWFDPANWLGGVPTALTTTYINGEGIAPAIGGSATTRELSLGTGGLGAATGSLDIGNGGTLDSATASIGVMAGTDYIVTISGATSSWQALGQFSGIIVGESGRGELHILNGADVVSNTSYVGWGTTADGNVLVDGAGSTWEVTQSSSDILHVGVAGSGTLVVTDGGVVTGNAGRIGSGATGSGTVTVSDGGQLNTTLSLEVGSFGGGDGRLFILDGGAVNTGTGASIGQGAGSESVVAVSGQNSVLNIGGNLRIGGSDGLTPNEAVLTINEGGMVNVTGSVDVAADSHATTSGVINIGAYPNSPAETPGTLVASHVDLNDRGVLNFNHAGTAYTFSTALRGLVNAEINHNAGTTIYTGDGSQYFGNVRVGGGTLLVDGVLGGNSGVVDVFDGATLGGDGTLGHDVAVADGTLAPGNSPGTLTVGGDLTLTSASVLDFELGDPAGTAGVDSDLIDVGGNLTLDGTLNVIDAGGFGAGTYRLFNYGTGMFGGMLTDNGLGIGTVPTGFTAADLDVLTGTVGQVDLLVGGGTSTTFAFWDGSNAIANNTVDGGDGTWTASATNWTDGTGSANGPYDPSSFLIFQGNSGSVFVDNSAGAVTVANGMQFAVSGYSVIGGDLTLSGATTIRVGDGTSASSGDVAIIGSDLIGAGSLTKTDFGRLVLSGTNSYAGGTIVTNGTLAGDTDSLQGDIVNNAELDFTQDTADGTYAGSLNGTGSTRKFGDHGLTFSGNSSAYAGSTSIFAGTLFVEDILGGSLSVLNGGTLGGNGTAGAVTVDGGGTLAPGNSIGTLSVAGATFDAGSIYEVELNDGGTVAGTNNDLLAASGAVTINGGAVHVTPENGSDDGTTYAVGSQYTIITAGGVTGTFASLADDYAFLDFALSYDANNVYLTSQMALTTFCLDGMTPNQCATGDGVFSLGSGNLWTAVLNLSDDEAPGALDQLSGEIHASAKAAFIEDSRFPREASLNRIRAAFETVGSPAQGDGERDVSETFALWGHGFGSWGKWDGDGNAAQMKRSVGGLFMGGDALVGDALRIGIFGGYQASDFDVDARSSSGSAETFTLGTYAGGQWNALGLRVGGAYGWGSVDTARSVAFTGFSDSLSADYDYEIGQVYGEAGYRIDAGGVSLEPFANLAYVNLRTDGFTEAGGAAALAVQPDTIDATFTTLGLRVETDIALADTQAKLRGMLGWRHAFGDVAPVSTHAFAGSDAFTVAGVPVAEDAFVLEAGFDVNLSANAILGLSYNGQFGSGVTDQGIKADFALEF